ARDEGPWLDKGSDFVRRDSWYRIRLKQGPRADNNRTRNKSSVALILIVVINHNESPDGDKVLKNALPMANRLAKLKQRCRGAGIPAIYVNDNFGQWRSDAKSLVRTCLGVGLRGQALRRAASARRRG